MTIDRLREILAATDPPEGTAAAPPDALQLSEMLWLACHITPEPEPAPPAAGDEAPPPADQHPTEEPSPPTSTPGPRPAPRPRVPVHPEPLDDTSGPGPDAVSVMVPTAPMLADPRALQRALRPLKRRVPSRSRWQVDEEATAARIADTGLWIPELIAEPERWLGLDLVVDTGPSMRLWRPLADELAEALLRQGAFTDVRAAYLHPTGTVSSAINSTPRGPATLVDPTGRRATLVLSDCSGPHWWNGRAARSVRRWAAAGPTAILQPLPERLWRRTAAPAFPGTAALPRPAAPNTELRFEPYDGSMEHGIPVPVLEIAPGWLAAWADLVAGVGRRPAAVTPLSSETRAAPVRRERELPIDERVRRFLAAASPGACELAAHIAVSVPSLPIMRLIQQRVLGGSGPSPLAEVLLSGLLRPIGGSADERYEFVPGARQALLDTLPRPEGLHTLHTLELVSAEIERRADSQGERFRGVIPLAEGSGATARAATLGWGPFALVNPEARRLLLPPGPPAQPFQLDEARQVAQSPYGQQPQAQPQQPPQGSAFPPIMRSAEDEGLLHRMRQSIGRLFGSGPDSRPPPQARAQRIAVASVDAYVGRSTVTALLADALAESGPGRVLAVDAAGSIPLTARLGLFARAAQPDLGVNRPRNFSEAERFLNRIGTGVWVLPGWPGSTRLAGAWTAADALSDHFGVVVADCDDALFVDPRSGPLAHTDVLVLVGTTNPANASRLVRLVENLASLGRYPRTVVVLRSEPNETLEERAEALRLFDGLNATVAVLPHDEHLASNGTPALRFLDEATRTAVQEIARLTLSQSRERPPDDWPPIPIGVDERGEPVTLNLLGNSSAGAHGLVDGARDWNRLAVLGRIVIELARRYPPQTVQFAGSGLGQVTPFRDVALTYVATAITSFPGTLAEALKSEVLRRERTLTAAEAGSWHRYQQEAARSDRLEPLPALFVVIDEIGAVLTDDPEFAEVLETLIVAGGRLGIHLITTSSVPLQDIPAPVMDSDAWRITLRTDEPDIGELRTGSSPSVRFRITPVLPDATNDVLDAAIDDALAGMGDWLNLGAVKRKLRDVLATEMAELRQNGRPLHRHLAFAGPSLVGKEPTAREYASAMARFGLLQDPQIVHTTWTTWTEVLFEQSHGRMLYIKCEDLPGTVDWSKSWRGRALAGLMNRHRDVLVVIAGTRDAVDQLCLHNPGIASALEDTVLFEPETADETVAFINLLANNQGLKLSQTAATYLKQLLERLGPEVYGESTAHALFNGAAARLEEQLQSMDPPIRDQWRTLQAFDFEEPTPQPATDAPPRIGLLGAPGSGKATFVVALRVAMTTQASNWQLVGTNESSTNFAAAAAHALVVEKRFPLSWLLIGTQEIRESRRFRPAVRRTIPARFQLDMLESAEAETGYDGMIFLFDPTRADGANTAVLRRFISTVRRRSNDHYLPVHIAVCVTKYDEPEVLAIANRGGFLSVPEDGEHVPRVHDDLADRLFEDLDQLGNGAREFRHEVRVNFAPERTRYFITSAAGLFVDPATGSFSHYGPANSAIRPINVWEPVDWLARSLTEQT